MRLGESRQIRINRKQNQTRLQPSHTNQGKEKRGSFSIPPPHSHRFCDVSYNNRGGEREREKRCWWRKKTDHLLAVGILHDSQRRPRHIWALPHPPPPSP